MSKGALGLTQLKGALERSQVLGSRRLRFSGHPWDSSLSQLHLMLIFSLVATMVVVAEDMPHPDSHSTLLDKGMQPSSHMESPGWFNSRNKMASAGCVPVPASVPGVRGGKLWMTTLGLCDWQHQ